MNLMKKMNLIKNIKKIIPSLKYCFGKNKFVRVEVCDCTDVCRMLPPNVEYYSEVNKKNYPPEINDWILDRKVAISNNNNIYMQI